MTRDQYCAAVERNNRRLYLLALSFTHNHYDSEDVTQNVFIKLWKHVEEFESDEHADKWMTVVCINECRNLLKYNSRRRPMTVEEAEKIYGVDRETKLDLLGAVLSLPHKESSVIQLYYYEELPVKDISTMFGIGESAVKARLKRGREHLKNILGDDFCD